MRATFTLFSREFKAYFYSPIAYVVAAAFLLVVGYRFVETLGQLTERGPRGTEWPLQFMLGDWTFWLVFLFVAPPLTMRLFAEEAATGTLEMLMTAPLRDWQVVAAKFLASFAFYALLWVPTLIFLPVLLDLDWVTFKPQIDPNPLWATYLGLGLAGGMFLALGLYVSSLFRSQMSAFLVAACLSLLFIVAGFWRGDSDTLFDQVVYFVSVPLHFTRDFTRGVIDTRHLIFYVSMTAFWLFLTVKSVESRRRT